MSKKTLRQWISKKTEPGTAPRNIELPKSGSIPENRALFPRAAARLYLLLFQIIILSALSACGQTGEWDEEVRLENGEILKIHRTQRWTTAHPIGDGRSYINKEAMLEVQSSKVSAPSEPWTGRYLFLMVIDVDPASGEYFIVATPDACWRWDELGSPDPPYVEYRFRDNKWQHVKWSGIAAGRAPNIWERPVLLQMQAVIQEEDIAWQARLPPPYGIVVEKGSKPVNMLSWRCVHTGMTKTIWMDQSLRIEPGTVPGTEHRQPTA